MRIALVSTPFVSVPPKAYGGTELVVAELALALRAQGHEVVVYATGDSSLPGVEIRHYFAEAQWPPEPSIEELHAAYCLRDIARDRRGFDVVHLHCPAAVPLARHLECAVVYTLHHDLDTALSQSYAAAPRTQIVAISRSQALREPAPIQAVIHHGLDPARFPPQADQGYLLFLGRYDRCKGPDLALDVAERAQLPLVMAGAPHEREFFEEEIAPRLSGSGVLELGPVGGPRKAALIARARAVLFPIRWDEPFGLVMIESMLAGVPVLALRRGSVPEVIDDGLTGLCCEGVAEMAAAAREVPRRFDRERVRSHARVRWSAARMARDYARLYRAAARDHRAAGGAVAVADADSVANS